MARHVTSPQSNAGSICRNNAALSIFWSFRFAVPRRKMPPPGPQISNPQPHMDISKWLDILELKQYHHIFDTYKGVEDLLQFSEAEIKELGVKNAAHRARIVTSLVALKDKYEKGIIPLIYYVLSTA
ncbi:uncharacterized protein LOC112126716 [Cimex lectularius]|uniref:SAM domain-containing protein n=1 Tax=Cimex lectularius TaxID=79782 RepID=A0A8I6SEK5_CIMLE|nr:uncharacterized protein LOC112126716 [Cimex lectularius]